MDRSSQKTNKAIKQHRRKIVPLLSFGVLLVILGQQIFFSQSVQATHIDQGLSGRLRQRELAGHRVMVEKHKKSKKSKSKKNSSQRNAESENKPQPQQPTESPQPQPVQQQQESQPQSQQEGRQDQQDAQSQQTSSAQQQQQTQEQTDASQQYVQTTQQQPEQTNSASPSGADVQVTDTAAEPQQEEKFRPKNQGKFVPSAERAHRSPLQLPDISVSGEEVHQETVDDISKASKEDVFAYSQVIALDDEAQAKLLQEMEPKPVNAEEDDGAVAQFMLDVSQQSQSLVPKVEAEQVQVMNDEMEPETGADFAAELAQKYEAQQKEREAGRGVAEKIAQSQWFQNSQRQQPRAQETEDQPPQDEQTVAVKEALEIDN